LQRYNLLPINYNLPYEITIVPTISLWPGPQGTRQRKANVPALSVGISISFVSPGLMRTFTPKSIAPKLWMPSLFVRRTMIFSPFLAVMEAGENTQSVDVMVMMRALAFVTVEAADVAVAADEGLELVIAEAATDRTEEEDPVWPLLFVVSTLLQADNKSIPAIPERAMDVRTIFMDVERKG